MESFLDGFRFVPDGTTTLSDALCSFIKEQITFGHLKGGEKLPTIAEIAKATGLTFGRARGIVERLSREGYVLSRPHSGTVVLSRNGNLLKGRVLVAYPDVDVCRYYPTQLLDILNRRLKAAGYSVSVVTFPFDESGNIAPFESELLRAIDLVIALRTPPKVQKCLAESGIRHIFAYGEKPIVDDGSPWISFSDEEALAQFVGLPALKAIRWTMAKRSQTLRLPSSRRGAFRRRRQSRRSTSSARLSRSDPRRGMEQSARWEARRA